MRLLMEIELEDFKSVNKQLNDKYTITTLLNEQDEKGWEKLIGKVFEFECDIEKNLKNEAIFSKDRVFIVKDGNAVIATAAAWYREEYGVDSGYIHMVAVNPDYRGEGLSYIVVNKALEYMKAEGRNKAILKTDDFRVAAVELYKKLGFTIRETI